jgi:hypothetical protein
MHDDAKVMAPRTERGNGLDGAHRRRKTHLWIDWPLLYSSG